MSVVRTGRSDLQGFVRPEVCSVFIKHGIPLSLGPLRLTYRRVEGNEALVTRVCATRVIGTQ